MTNSNSLVTFTETGVTHMDLWNMGWDYCKNEGRETDFTRTVFKDFMKPEWVNLRPVPTPNANTRIVVDRPFKSVSEDIADCVWSNAELRDVFAADIRQSANVGEFALIIENALDTAETKETWDGAMTVLALCN